MTISARDRTQLGVALKEMVDELFKRNGQLDQIDLVRFYPQFEDRELSRILPVVARLVAERSFGHYTVEAVSRDRVRGDLFKCRVFLRFVKVSNGNAGNPPRQYFAFGPRKGVVASN